MFLSLHSLGIRVEEEFFRSMGFSLDGLGVRIVQQKSGTGFE